MVRSASEILLENYEELSHILTSQNILLDKIIGSDDEKLLNEYIKLTERWATHQSNIDNITSSLANQFVLDNKLADEIQSKIVFMINASKVLENKLEKIKNSDADLMLKLKKKQMTLRGYGGMTQYDVTPLYMDEKQ
ncbi:hypothetical protein ACFSTH_19415 [Paenibacillus yanchengensis]|uniref:Flagellar protein FliT n=1 Tax=Paenibacillus yanchengensis TaxID=2035833 RepID=A0ABW4YML8_9BACL